MKFPAVPQLSPAELALWLRDSSRPQPVLLDVRNRTEYEMGHLPGARHCGPGDSVPSILAGVGADLPVVVYCSVGYRSSALAARMIKAGRHQVANLDGSIFQWANEGRALETNNGAAPRVHPYHPWFQPLLVTERKI
ncbi:MAG TPA: rhodanese-like domain-containing protein [Candidatus Limnocylindria bacterium]|nr:rhodanese-like domain-containing protein [Candidatus Limnocylindria bacterium]